MKKGFLNDLSQKGKASNIYPDAGSAEGEGGAKGGETGHHIRNITSICMILSVFIYYMQEHIRDLCRSAKLWIPARFPSIY